MQKEILERLEALERRNHGLEQRSRRLTLAVGAMALVLLFAVCFAATNPEEIVDVLRVHRLEIVDPSGVARAAFDASEEDVVLVMGKEDGEHIYLEAETDGGLAFVSVGNKRSLEMHSEASDRTGLYLYDSNEENQGWFIIQDDDRSDLRLMDQDNKIAMTFLDDHKPFLGLCNGENAVLSLMVQEDGAGHVIVMDPATQKTNSLDP
ncbi:MAG: hypothetical protein ACYC2Y_10535 [Armatimonadota bacterium]